MARNQPNNAIVVDKCTQRLTALKNHVSAKATIAIDGVVHKATEVIDIYQHSIDTRAALASKRAEVRAAMADRADAEQERRAADRALKAWVQNKFGVTSQQAMDFGFAPPKAVSRTVESKALAVAKAKATRTARHTMGKKERQKIRGVVADPTAQPATPVASSASSTASQAPPPQAATPSQPASTNGVSTPSSLNGAASH